MQPGLFIGVPGGVGFAVNSGQLSFATIKPNADPVKNPSHFDRTYTAISASLRGVGLSGLPTGVIIEATRLEFSSNSSTGTNPGSPIALDWTHAIDLQAGDTAFDADAIVVNRRTLGLTPAGFELQVLSLDLRYNAPDHATGTRLNWAGVSQVASTPVAQITGFTQLAVSGRLYLNVSGFVVAAAAFDLSQVSGVPVNDGHGTNIPLASILLLHLSDVFLFIGIG